MPLAEPFRHRQRSNAVMTVHDKRTASEDLINFPEAGGNLAHGNNQQSSGRGNLDRAISRLLRLANIEQRKRLARVQSLLENCCS